MLDYQAELGDLATVCEPYDNSFVPQRSDEVRQDEGANWDNYALFVFEQQGSYCQLG